ncbi:MFS transporter [Streptomyces griseofuscus]|uniref:MFS transporter n=1 Tax=Streptomyces griseofuscus TaxID=146922 RepID=UPI00345594AC
MSRISSTNRRLFDRRERMALAGAALAALVVELDWMVVNIALPRIADDLHRSPTDLQWLITAFTLGFGGLMPVSGWVTDAFGRRRTTIYGIELFLLSSILCAAAHSLPWLVAGRALQGVAGSFIVPGAVAMTSAVFTGRKRDAGIGVVLGLASGGAAMAPFFGGLLVAWLGWRSVFLVNVPVGIAAIALIYYRVTPSNNPAAVARRPPLLNGACVVLGATALTVTADRGTTWGWSSPATLACLTAGGALLAGFVLLERNEDRALVSRHVYRERRQYLLVLAGTASTIAFIILTSFSVLYLEDGIRLSTLLSGCVLLGFSVPNALSAYAAGQMPGQRNPYRLLCISLAVCAAGLAGLAAAPFPGLYALALCVCGIGTGMSGALTNVLAQQGVSAQEAGATSSMALAVRSLAAAVATSLAATTLESLHHGVNGAAADASGIATILRATAVFPALALLLLLPTATARSRSR